MLLYCAARQQLPNTMALWHLVGHVTHSNRRALHRNHGTPRQDSRQQATTQERGTKSTTYRRKVVGTLWQPRGQEMDSPFFVLPNPPSDVSSAPHWPLRLEADGQLPAALNDTSGGTGGVCRIRSGGGGGDPPTTRRRSSSPASRATIRNADEERTKAPPATRKRVAHLRQGLLPVKEVLTKKSVRVPMTTPNGETEKHTQTELPLDACQEEALLTSKSTTSGSPWPE